MCLGGSGRGGIAEDERMNREAWNLPPTARSVPQARQHVGATLRHWHLDGLAETARLLTSEVVTNAVLHARTAMTLAVEETEAGIRVSVTDGSPVPPAMRRHSVTATTGRGLQLLDQLADAWSVDGTKGGKTVWFTLSAGSNAWQLRRDSQWLTEVEA
jgi:anti-sigma regulatory factor (Ser/Thr protein kinase)